MNKKVYLSILLLSVFALLFWNPFKKKETLSVCAMFKNEAPNLKEWIDYHHKVMRVGKFYLYNNESTDNYLEVLSPYIEKGLVKLIDWDNRKEHALFGIDDSAPQCPYQFGAYRDCLKKRAKKRSVWVAIIDIDEFIVPTGGVDTFYQMLEEEKKKKTGSIRIHWKIFGTAGVKSLQPGESLLGKLDKRPVDSHPWNENVKSIHRPELVRRPLIHETLKVNKKGYTIKTLPRNMCRIHHYWTGTEETFWAKRGYSKKKGEEFLKVINAVEDRTIHPYLELMND